MQKLTKSKRSLSPATRVSPRKRLNYDVDSRKMSSPMGYDEDAQLSFLTIDEEDEEEVAYSNSMEELMKLEKERYPWASTWAPAEERLFEILYMRQDLPMLPTTWDVDLRGVPISDIVFQTSDDFPPIIYAHSTDFRATTALIRLMDLTAKTRTTIQSGLRMKVPQLIKRELDKYLSWAAQDGDYLHLRIVPNILTEIVDTKMLEHEITEHIQNRMRALAKLQREFLREDRNPQFWDVIKPSVFASPKIKLEPDDGLTSFGGWLTPAQSRLGSHPQVGNVLPTTETHEVAVKIEPGFKSPSISAKVLPKTTMFSRESCHSQSPSPSLPEEPQTPPRHTYRRHPPVVYGLFIINTWVLVLTVDSSKGSDAHVSFQVQVNFQDEHQGIWNALTIAIAACLARDELRTRVTDFEELPCVEDSDPDA
ncbi:hypothetical protein H9Q69_005269 [Fusarium xylarioides]|uniref:Uncharacterized protein n=1 Tax=Fusarium xylarioides TaxID=221167 RepID=A0A9P7LAT3_9HYPO|nr:hypothetical protein H9Q72_000898 [Fusarium xylarioides]KAG5795701.1 hypothetical protein H9Q69_005269 [Fusarium xylarioides]